MHVQMPLLFLGNIYIVICVGSFKKITRIIMKIYTLLRNYTEKKLLAPCNEIVGILVFILWRMIT